MGDVLDSSNPCAVSPYALTGPHVEPNASYWAFCARLCLVSIEKLREVTDQGTPCPEFKCDDHPFYAPAARCRFPEHPNPQTNDGCGQIQAEFEELVELATRRDDPCSVSGGKSGKLGCRRPISRLFNLQPSALGAVVVHRSPGEQVIRTGRGLARAVESDTPGLFHRHALNYLMLRRPGWSPPRQALVWAALDVAIASALQAAWYYKWLSPRPLTSRRERPIEYAQRTGQSPSLPILFDGPDELNPGITKCPTIHPGTPRHPAYPSGHSTYAGAASGILRFFFGNDPTPPALQATPGDENAFTIGRELDNLADNIGLGRMWAGIHWRTDHTAGLTLGRTVARLVLEQLFATGNLRLCVPPGNPQDPCKGTTPPCDEGPPPSIQQLDQRRSVFMETCGDVIEQTPCPFVMTKEALAEFGFASDEELAAERDRTYRSLQKLAKLDQALLDTARSPQEGAGTEDGERPEERRE